MCAPRARLAALGLPAALALSLGSCSLYQSSVSLAVSLPALPQHWQETFPGLVFLLDHPGADVELPVAAGSQQVELRPPKRTCLPVVAQPCLPGSGLRLPCAGGVYPLDVGPGETLPLSWRSGPAAQLLLELDGQGLDLEHLNVPRLCAEMDLRGGEDPWNLDLVRIAAGLASGQMRVTEIRLQPLAELRLPAGPGRWFLESPLRLPCPADADGIVSLPGVAPGFHRLFALAGGERLDLFVSDREVLWVRRAAGVQLDRPPDKLDSGRKPALNGEQDSGRHAVRRRPAEGRQ